MWGGGRVATMQVHGSVVKNKLQVTGHHQLLLLFSCFVFLP